MLDDGSEIITDTVYTELGVKVNSELAQRIGVEVNSSGRINVDLNQKTNIAGIYAAGDVTSFDRIKLLRPYMKDI